MPAVNLLVSFYGIKMSDKCNGGVISQGIFITRVQPDGPAAASLRPGDKILEVGRQEQSQKYQI